MAQPLPPYNWSYPDGTDDPADWPTIVQQNLLSQSGMVIGQFDTQASALAALGTSSQAPMFYTTQNPTTLWCLDASGANPVWTLGGGYTTGSLTVTDNSSNNISLGTSQRYLKYRVEGAHVYGWAEWVIGTSVAWPAAGTYFRFSLPFPVQNSTAGVNVSAGSAMVTVGGNHYPGVVDIGTGSSSCVLYINDMSRTNGTTLLPVSVVSGSGTTTTRVFAAGDIVRFNFDYERAV